MSITLPSIGIQDLAPITPQSTSGPTPNGFEQVVEQVSDTLKQAD